MVMPRAFSSGAASRIQSGSGALSQRAHQLFRLLILGHCVSEIGALQRLAANTVSAHRAPTIGKTGTKNDFALAIHGECSESPRHVNFSFG